MSKTVYDELIEFLKDGEKVEAVVLGFDDYIEDAQILAEKIGVVLSWEEAAPLLQALEWYGCWCDTEHPFWAWTQERVIFPVGYDCLFWLGSIPRAPMPCKPQIFGKW